MGLGVGFSVVVLICCGVQGGMYMFPWQWSAALLCLPDPLQLSGTNSLCLSVILPLPVLLNLH